MDVVAIVWVDPGIQFKTCVELTSGRPSTEKLRPIGFVSIVTGTAARIGKQDYSEVLLVELVAFA